MEGAGELRQMQDSEISYTALDAGEIHTIDPAACGEFLLGPPTLIPEGLHLRADLPQEGRLRVLRHGGMVARRGVAYGLRQGRPAKINVAAVRTLRALERGHYTDSSRHIAAACLVKTN